jgi:hypothetical protein
MYCLLVLLLQSYLVRVEERRNVFCCLLALELDTIEFYHWPFFVDNHNCVGVCGGWGY